VKFKSSNSSEILLKILAKSPNEKGSLFEAVMTEVLECLGFGNLKVNVRRAGRELDILGKHRVTKHPILAKCKAHRKKVGGSDIQKFYGSYNIEYRKRSTIGDGA
jgi:hypothetical protein